MGRHKRALTNQVLGAMLIAVMLACAGVIGSRMFAYPTLLIVNQSMEPVRVYGSAGLLANVYPHEEKCVKLKQMGNLSMLLRQQSAIEWAPQIDPETSPGWKIVVRNMLKFDVLSLQPAEACK